jgi:hypothetical protein
MATVHTYFEPVPGMSHPTKLLDLWRESWESRGWEIHILSEDDARGHPGYKAFSDRISRYPTTNNPAYERACYMRHLAMANIGGGILVDYDVFLRSVDVPKEDAEMPLHAVILEPTRVPCAVIGNADAFGDICDIIYEHNSSGQNHVSDMTILRKSKIPTSPQCIEHLCSGRPIENDLGDGWKTAPMIHFSTYSFSKLGWTGDKADLIRRVLATL